MVGWPSTSVSLSLFSVIILVALSSIISNCKRSVDSLVFASLKATRSCIISRIVNAISSIVKIWLWSCFGPWIRA